jgi:ComF family protein
MGYLKALKGLILDALFPPVCASCKKEGDFLCADCLGSLVRKRIRPYPKKQDPPEFRHLDGVIYALDYAKNPQIKAAIKQFKYRFTEELAIPFARLIVEKVGELGMAQGRPLALIPIPLHAKRFRERGFNQAEVVARSIQSEAGQGAYEVLPLLVRQKATSQQAKLNRVERQANLENAFIMNKKFVHRFDGEKIYFLVDDVCTTGATLDNAARVLKEAGIPKVYGLVVARALVK